MANQLMKRCSASCPKSRTRTAPSAGEDVGQQELSHCWWECKTVPQLWEAVWWFLTKLNILLPYDPAIVLLDIYPNEVRTLSTQKLARGCL